ncbi:TetR/AcrR family transcriptional regulator [Acidocella sp.]|uniref:TetR/AcrR family transcriptional regulator n=1 Tax=Acidocella sp. TaxID=50710 RepID=UPI003D02678A
MTKPNTKSSRAKVVASQTDAKIASPISKSGGDQSNGARTALIKQSALDTAARIFAEKGYRGTSLRDVADGLGISRPGLYYHFPSKEKLIEALVEEVTVSSQRQSSAIAERSELEPAEALRLVTQSHAKWILEHRLLFKVVDRSESELPARLLGVHSTAKRAVLENFTKIIDRGIDRGLFRPINARVAAFSIIGMCSWTAWWFKPDGKLVVEEIVQTLGDMALASVLRRDPYRERSADPIDGLRILREDIDHLERLIQKPNR